jgi:hypothetical protein
MALLVVSLVACPALAQTSVALLSHFDWWDGSTTGGGSKTPVSWKAFYKEGDEWKPVETSDEFGVAKDQYNNVNFKKVKSTGLRLEIVLPTDASVGTQNWKARQASSRTVRCNRLFGRPRQPLPSPVCSHRKSLREWFTQPAHGRLEPKRGVEIAGLGVELVNIDLNPRRFPLPRPRFARLVKSAGDAPAAPVRMNDQVVNHGMLLPNECLKAWRVAQVNGSQADTFSGVGDEQRRVGTSEQHLEPLRRAGIAAGFLKEPRRSVPMQTIELFE